MKSKRKTLNMSGILVVLLGLICVSNTLWALGSSNPQHIIFDMRVYQNMEGKGGVSTSSYVEPHRAGNIASKTDLEAEQAKLRSIFNVRDIRLRINTQWLYESKYGKRIFRIFNKNGSKTSMLLTVEDKKDNFRLEVFDGKKSKKSRNLLDTAVELPAENTIILGFKDLENKVYFLAFHRRADLKDVSAIRGDIGQIRGSTQYQAELVDYVQPQYPPAALKEGIEGTVMLRAGINKSGNVVDVEILSGHPLLKHAASRTISQFKYKPPSDKAKSFPVPFSAILSFKLPEEKQDIDGGSIIGRVTLENNDSIIPGVEVQLVDKKNNILKTTNSDRNGTYGFMSIPAGNYTLTYKKNGYLTIMRKLYLKGSETSKVNVYFRARKAGKKYIMKQKAWVVGDKYFIKDETKKDIYYVKGKAFTIGKKLSLRDMTGKELARISQKPFSIGQKAKIYRNNEEIAKVVKKFSLKDKFTVTIPGGKSIKVTGNFWKYKYTLTRKGKKVASVSKKFFIGSDKYGVEILPGEDEVLILAIVVIIDLFSHSDNK